jgi:hypothetical protein
MERTGLRPRPILLVPSAPARVEGVQAMDDFPRARAIPPGRARHLCD